MKKTFVSRSGFVSQRVLIGLFFCLGGVFLALVGLGKNENARSPNPVPRTHVARAAVPLSVIAENPAGPRDRAGQALFGPTTRSSFMARWDSVAGALGYRLDVSASSSFSSFVSGYQDVDVGNVTGQVVTGLGRGTVYYYRVRAYYASGPSVNSSVMTATTVPTAGLIINPTFDSSILNDPDAVAIQAMINQAISIYESLFNDSMTIQIRFRYSTTAPDGTPLDSTVVALSTKCGYSIPWNDFITRLRASATTSNDAIANASLPGSPPQGTNIEPSSAGGRAVGLGTAPAAFANGQCGAGGPYDGIITLNSAQSFQFTRPPVANRFDALRATEHEIDEVMGLGSFLNANVLVNGCGTGDLWPQDLFSWSSAGNRNLCINGERYFSIDSGTTNIVNFNQLGCPADFGDWQSDPSDTCSHTNCPQPNPYVQNAFGCQDQFSDTTATSPEGINLDVIGYDLRSVTPGPTAITNSPTDVTSTSVKLHGTVNPNGSGTFVYFEYGLTAGYGSSTTPQGSFGGTSSIPVQETVPNLSPNTTYHYRLVAGSSAGTNYGDDVGFTTLQSGGGSLIVTNVNSLVSAIAYANANPTIPDQTITFNLPGSGPWTITTSTTLEITALIKIDGTSQPGYDGQFNRVYVEGAVGVPNVFDFRSHDGTFLIGTEPVAADIKGLGIYNFDNAGVLIDNANRNWIEDCYIGFKQSGVGILLNTARSSHSTGIEMRGNNNQVHRSTISGVENGLVIGEPISQVTGLVSTDNLFEGNRIGADPTGQTTVGYGNTSNGILLGAGVKSSWIGAWASDGYNVIAGNGGSGIEIGHPTDDHNRIFYNYFGVNNGGTRVITGNTNQQAILIDNGAQYNAAWSNVIAGNRGAGIIVASSNNWILGNIIGLNQTQTQALGEQPYGILVKIDTVHTPGVAPQGNAIGGSDPDPPYYSFGNVICNQSLNGIEMENAVGNGVMCNWIGFSTAGQPFPNASWGAYLLNSSGNSSFGCLNAWGPNGLGRVGESGGTGNSIQ